MTIHTDFVCCNKQISFGEVWFLQDIKGFTARKLYISKCEYCDEEYALLVEKRIEDNKVFSNKLKGIEAVKTIYREKKRKVAVFPNIKSDSLFGWIYGVNVEIKNKKGKTTQIRQYSADFNGNKKLVKKMKV